MKNKFFFSTLLFFAGLNAGAKNYYVAANGNNANNGLTATTPWQSIAKVNSAFTSILAGDSILFRRGDTFYGAIVVGKSGTSGKPIVISAYGTGAKPIITGFTNVTSWATVSTGIYQAYVPGAKSTLNMVAMNGTPKALGRYPNATDANGGYLNYEAFGGSTSITDNQLTSTTNWTGAEVVIRKKLWVLDRGKITAHSAGKITYTNTNGSTYDGTNGFGYFIQNDARTLDQLGEWYFKSSTKYLQIYFGTAAPSSYSVKVSTIDTLLRMSSKSYINISNLVFEGANGDAINAATGSYVNIQNCDFVNAGVGAINIKAISNLLIENCTSNNVLNTAFTITNGSSANVTIRGCTVKNTGTLAGMGLSNGNSYKGIMANASSNLLIEYNKVDTTGYLGIEFQGNNVNVRYNVVNYFDFIKDDAGGIYTYTGGSDASPGTIYTNRTVSNNIVMNGAGAPKGRNSATLFASGIYLDGRSMNVSILNNTVFNNAKNGIHTNNAVGITVKGNTSYNNLNAMSAMRWVGNTITNLTIKNNIFYPTNAAQRGLYYTNSGINQPAATTVKTALTNLGNIDSNTYNVINPTPFNFEIYTTSGGALIQTSPLSLEGWRAASNHDLKGAKPSRMPVTYKLGALVGANKFTNGAFNSAISGLTVFGASTLGAWDNTGMISGGSLKMSFSVPVANKYSMVHSPIGAVSSAKKYILRVSTYGSTQQGIVRAYLRRSTSPYDNLVATQTKSFGTGKTDHEFLFDAPTTVTAASFVIEIEQNSGTTFLDNISFYEATATTYDPVSQVRFEYNPGKTAKTVALDATYIAVNGTSYTGSVTLQPFTSIILVKDMGTTLARTAAADSTVADSTIIDSTSLMIDSLARPVTTTQQAATETGVARVDISATAANDSLVVKDSLKTAPAIAARMAPAIVLPQSKPLQVTAYPNPSTNVFNLMLQGGNDERVTVMLYTFDGKLVYQTNGNGNSKFTFGNNLTPGVYIVKVVQGNTVQTLKLVKAGN